MVMAGGTGGHVFPGLAVAHHLMDQGWQVRWLGTADRMEADLVPKNGIEIDFIRISGLRGKGIKAQLLAPVRIFNAWRQARAIMKRFQPDVVLGMGGYVSGPGGLAAWSLGIPVVLHEQNGIAGLTNKWLAKIAKKVMQAFPGAFPHADVVGNPVRTDVLALPLPNGSSHGFQKEVTRRIRYGSARISRTTAEIPMPIMAMNCHSFAPARNSIASVVTNRTTTVPRSGCASSRMASTKITPIGFKKPRRLLRTSSTLRTR